MAGQAGPWALTEILEALERRIRIEALLQQWAREAVDAFRRGDDVALALILSRFTVLAQTAEEQERGPRTLEEAEGPGSFPPPPPR